MSVVFKKAGDAKPQAQKSETCKKCGGTGKIPVDDDTVALCVCRITSMLRDRLGEEVSQAATIPESPFVEMLRSNLMITAQWPEMLNHLKFAFIRELMRTAFRFRFRVVTDEQLRAAYLSGGDRYEKPDDEKEDKMSDLVSEDIDLVIIRLGFLGYKNQAMPGILFTALRSREAALKPTWLVDDPTVPFTKGHLSWNEDVGAYVSSRYGTATIEADA